MKIQQFCTKN